MFSVLICFSFSFFHVLFYCKRSCHDRSFKSRNQFELLEEPSKNIKTPCGWGSTGKLSSSVSGCFSRAWTLYVLRGTNSATTRQFRYARRDCVIWISLEKRWNSQKINYELLIFSWWLVTALIFILAFLLCRISWLFSGISIRFYFISPCFIQNTTNLMISSLFSLFCSCFIRII